MDNEALFFTIFNLAGKNPALDTLMIFGARFLIYLTFLLMFVLAFKGGAKERKVIILVLLSLPLVFLIIAVIHLFFIEPRPFISYQFTPLIPFPFINDPSFPSRHASIISAIAFSYYYFKSKWAPLFFIFAIWVGVSRIYVGVHYPLDILGGVMVGIVSLIITKQIVKFLKIRFGLG
ncbi:phosphatase PAP2 family protein [Candidatus Microgenomates bacterium]|nr:phosphatase PAP2 family protein [Candidatus Microgenomates bacterium]